jgi:hypothetical protein
LADGIYPTNQLFVKTIAEAQGESTKFAKTQEACRKDVERCFGVLKQRFAFVDQPIRLHNFETIVILQALVILNNMIVESERDPEAEGCVNCDEHFHRKAGPIEPLTNDTYRLLVRSLTSEASYARLRDALRSHINSME